MSKELEEKTEKFVEGIEKVLFFLQEIHEPQNTKEVARRIYEQYFGDSKILSRNFDKKKNRLILEVSSYDCSFIDKASVFQPWAQIVQYMGFDLEIREIIKGALPYKKDPWFVELTKTRTVCIELKAAGEVKNNKSNN